MASKHPSQQGKLSRRSLLKWGLGGAASAVATMGYADYAAYSLSVERHEIRLPRWTANGYRIAVISDVHVNHVHATSRARTAVSLALAEKPDVLVVPGDFVNSSREAVLANVRDAFADIADAGVPCLAVMGNHDYWTDAPVEVMEAVRSTSLRLLVNETFEHAGVTFAGLDDAIGGFPDYGFFRRGSVSNNLVTLLHEPDFVDGMPEHASLQISGHSHGGQVCLPFGVVLHTPRGAKRYRAGFYADAKVPLFVTRGVGTVGPDMRLFCRPEVSILTLRGA